MSLKSRSQCEGMKTACIMSRISPGSIITGLCEHSMECWSPKVLWQVECDSWSEKLGVTALWDNRGTCASSSVQRLWETCTNSNIAYGGKRAPFLAFSHTWLSEPMQQHGFSAINFKYKGLRASEKPEHTAVIKDLQAYSLPPWPIFFSFASLHWLPLLHCIKYELLIFTFKVLHSLSPVYLTFLLCLSNVNSCLWLPTC